jgi:hypothetical protein
VLDHIGDIEEHREKYAEIEAAKPTHRGAA